jgi:molybdate transport system permease protein
MDLMPLILSLKLAGVTTAALVVIAAPLAYVLVFYRMPAKTFLEAAINLPIVLPPTVLGFYLLVSLGPRSIIGGAWNTVFGFQLLFTFTGIVIASMVYSLPFAVAPMKSAFARMDPRLVENAQVLGLTPLQVFFRVILPNSLPGITASAILVFLHTIGEFGVILMVGGSIPGRTKVASIAIYEAVEALRYQDAWLMSLALVPVCYLFLLIVNRLTPEVRHVH